MTALESATTLFSVKDHALKGTVESHYENSNFGAAGQLGTDLCREFCSLDVDLTSLTHQDLELCDHQSVADTLSATAPEVVVNTVAMTNVEACEENAELAFAVNGHAVDNLARVCSELNALLVHISTDYVFGGDQRTPYSTDAPFSPLNVYGGSKAAGDDFVRSRCDRYLIIRTSGLYGLAGSSGKGGNFVETMLRLGQERGTVSVVKDQVLSPTYSLDVARTVRRLVDVRAQGMFHVTNSGSCSWYEFARAIFDLRNPTVEVQPITSTTFGSKVRRPSYSVLDGQRLNENGIGPLRPWRQALEAYMWARQECTGMPITSEGESKDSQEDVA